MMRYFSKPKLEVPYLWVSALFVITTMIPGILLWIGTLTCFKYWLLVDDVLEYLVGLDIKQK